MFLNPQAVLACCSPSRVASCTPYQEFRECWRVLKRIIVNLIRESWNKYFIIRVPDSFLLEEKVDYYFILNLSNLWVLFAGACRHAYNGFKYIQIFVQCIVLGGIFQLYLANVTNVQFKYLLDCFMTPLLLNEVVSNIMKVNKI